MCLLVFLHNDWMSRLCSGSWPLLSFCCAMVVCNTWPRLLLYASRHGETAFACMHMAFSCIVQTLCFPKLEAHMLLITDDIVVLALPSFRECNRSSTLSSRSSRGQTATRRTTLAPSQSRGRQQHYCQAVSGSSNHKYFGCRISSTHKTRLGFVYGFVCARSRALAMDTRLGMQLRARCILF